MAWLQSESWVVGAVVVAIMLAVLMRSLPNARPAILEQRAAEASGMRHIAPSTDVAVRVERDVHQRNHHDEVAVRVTNTGARTVTVTGWGVSLPSKRKAVWLTNHTDTVRLPYQLRPTGEVIRFRISAGDLRRIATEEGISCQDMRAYVALTDGIEFYSSGGVPLQ